MVVNVFKRLRFPDFLSIYVDSYIDFIIFSVFVILFKKMSVPFFSLFSQHYNILLYRLKITKLRIIII